MSEPICPDCPADRKPHPERVKEIDKLLPEGKTGAVCIDNTEVHKAWYLHELQKYPRLTIVFQGALTKDIYVIKVRKEPSRN